MVDGGETLSSGSRLNIYPAATMIPVPNAGLRTGIGANNHRPRFAFFALSVPSGESSCWERSPRSLFFAGSAGVGDGACAAAAIGNIVSQNKRRRYLVTEVLSLRTPAKLSKFKNHGSTLSQAQGRDVNYRTQALSRKPNLGHYQLYRSGETVTSNRVAASQYISVNKPCI